MSGRVMFVSDRIIKAAAPTARSLNTPKASGQPDRAAEKHVRDHTHCVSSGTSEWREGDR